MPPPVRGTGGVDVEGVIEAEVGVIELFIAPVLELDIHDNEVVEVLVAPGVYLARHHNVVLEPRLRDVNLLRRVLHRWIDMVVVIVNLVGFGSRGIARLGRCAGIPVGHFQTGLDPPEGHDRADAPIGLWAVQDVVDHREHILRGVARTGPGDVLLSIHIREYQHAIAG